MNHDSVELVFCEADSLPEAFRKSKKGSIYLTPYRVRDEGHTAHHAHHRPHRYLLHSDAVAIYRTVHSTRWN
jgi:hypothetical protein